MIKKYICVIEPWGRGKGGLSTLWVGGGHYFVILWQLAIHKKKSAVAPAGTWPFTNTSLLNKFPVIVSLVQ